MASKRPDTGIIRMPYSKWASLNPKLPIGIIGVETDTGKGKVGDGTSTYLSLPYTIFREPSVSTGGSGNITIWDGSQNKYHQYITANSSGDLDVTGGKTIRIDGTALSSLFASSDVVTTHESTYNHSLLHARSHGLTSTDDHTVSGLTIGHFLKATGASSFAFAPHGLTYSDVGAASNDHVHTGVYLPIDGTAADSSKLGGSDASAYALASHQHNMTDIIVNTTLRLCPQVEFGKIQATTKPSVVDRGAFVGYSMPVYNNDNQELYISQSVPRRWDGQSDIIFGFLATLDTANTNKKFKMQVDWEHVTAGDILPATTHATSVEVSTGAASQYMTYDMTFILDYDIDTPDVVVSNDILGIRLRRVAASSDEITGNVIVSGFYVQYNRNKIGPTV